MSIADATDAADGVLVMPSASASTTARATIRACGASLRLTPSKRAVITCGSVIVRTLTGAVQAVLDNGLIVVTISAGSSASLILAPVAVSLTRADEPAEMVTTIKPLSSTAWTAPVSVLTMTLPQVITALLPGVRRRDTPHAEIVARAVVEADAPTVTSTPSAASVASAMLTVRPSVLTMLPDVTGVVEVSTNAPDAVPVGCSESSTPSPFPSAGGGGGGGARCLRYQPKPPVVSAGFSKVRSDVEKRTPVPPVSTPNGPVPPPVVELVRRRGP